MKTIKKTITKTELSQMVCARMNDILKEQNISQALLVKKMQDAGYSILQSDASKILSNKSKANMYFLAAFSEVLGVSLDELLCGRHNKASLILGDRNFQIDPTECDGFQNILGDYFVYFNSTDHQEKDILVSGRLSFQKREGFCEAVMVLERAGSGRNLKKTYSGQMVLSRKMSSGYVLLSNDNYGELSMFIFRYRDFLTRPMECRLALAVTSSAGERRPTAHRLALSRRRLDEREQNAIIAILKIGYRDILIEEEKMNDCLKNNLQQQELVKTIINEVKDKHYFLISDEDIRKSGKRLGKWELVQVKRMLSEWAGGSLANVQIGEEDDAEMFAILDHLALEK